jgi:two-component system, NtrC family, sensor kinase
LALPYRQREWTAKSRSRGEPARVARPRILVVDDTPSIHDDFRKILDRGNQPSQALRELEATLLGDEVKTPTSPLEPPEFDIDSAYQGQEALNAIVEAREAGRPYALAFIDVRMPPGWNGLLTTAMVLDADSDIHVVLCTAYSDHGWNEIVDTVGETDRVLILKKPFNAIEVRQLSHTLTSKWRLARANRRRMAHLEQRVAERTQDLQAANQQLRHEMQERIRAEAELRKAQRLEALGRLAAGIGHEINNPLSFITASLEAAGGELEAVRDQLPAGLYEDLEELLGAAAIGADRIAQIVRNIRLVSRPSEAPAELVDVSSALALCAKMVQCEIDPRIEIALDLPPVPPVIGKRVELEQVFINLFKNAAHALIEQPTAAPRIEASARCEEGAVVVEIADNGPGIPEHLLDKIFDPFFTTKPMDRGSGLGLSICHSIVNALGGTIGIHSQEGHGTTVSVRLPRAPSHAPRHPRLPTSDPALPIAPVRGRILVVDDEPLMLRAFERALSDHEVVTATDGRAALALCMSEPFDVILCDIMMPGVNGRDFFEMLKQTQPGAEARIVFVTGGILVDEVREFLTSVPNECLEKPFASAALRKKVARKLGAL